MKKKLILLAFILSGCATATAPKDSTPPKQNVEVWQCLKPDPGYTLSLTSSQAILANGSKTYSASTVSDVGDSSYYFTLDRGYSYTYSLKRYGDTLFGTVLVSDHAGMNVFEGALFRK